MQQNQQDSGLNTRSLAYAFPPEGGLGEFPWDRVARDCSLLAGHVGNIDGSTGSGDSVKKSWRHPSSAEIRRDGLYVRNLQTLEYHCRYHYQWWPRKT